MHTRHKTTEVRPPAIRAGGQGHNCHLHGHRNEACVRHSLTHSLTWSAPERRTRRTRSAACRTAVLIAPLSQNTTAVQRYDVGVAMHRSRAELLLCARWREGRLSRAAGPARRIRVVHAVCMHHWRFETPRSNHFDEDCLISNTSRVKIWVVESEVSGESFGSLLRGAGVRMTP
jgi:hypothetical protein